MSLQKILVTALGFAASIIVMLVSAWGAETTMRVTSMETRLNIVEQHYAAIESQLSDIRQHLDEVRSDLHKEGR